MTRTDNALHRPELTAEALPCRCLLVLVALVGAGACAATPGAGRTLRGSGPEFRLEAEVSLDRSNGEVTLRLEPGTCVRDDDVLFDDGRLEGGTRACPPFPDSGWQATQLVTPWGQTFAASQSGPNWVVFVVEWNSSGVDPLADDVDDVLGRPWQIVAPDAREPFVWTPDEDQRASMLQLIGAATDTQLHVDDVDAPPVVEVTDFRADGELRNGTENELVLTVTNHGAGDAYRLSATTRSNVPALHGLRFSFGQLRSGKSKTRRVKVSLPRENDEAEALVVLVFAEAHRFAPAQTSKRYRVHAASDFTVVSMACEVIGSTSEKTKVDAGQRLQVSCNLHNDGASARGLRLRGRITGGEGAMDSGPFDLGVDRTTVVTLPLDVPRDAAIDSERIVNLKVVDHAAHTLAETSLTLVIVRPQICPEGKLTRQQFDEKRTKLRRALDAGLLSKEEYDRYEAELVGCLE